MNKLFKSIIAASVGVAMVIGVGVGLGREANAIYASSSADVPYNASWNDEGTQSTGSAMSVTIAPFTIALSKGYKNTTHTHAYANGTITITGDNTVSTIDSVVITANGKYSGLQSGGALSVSGAGTNPSVTGDDYSATITKGTGTLTNAWTIGNNKQIRFTNIAITYSSASGTDTYKVTYDAHGGTGSTLDLNSYESGALVTVKTNGFIRIGYEFDHWNTKEDNTGTSYNPGNQFNIGGNVTLYAQWAIDSDGLGTENNPFNVEEARDAIDEYQTIEQAYVQGIVSEVVSYNSTYSSITYNISDDGTTNAEQLKVYSGKGLNNTDFDSINGVKVAASVVVTGNLKKHNSDYEFDYNNYLVSYVESQRKLVSIAVSGQQTQFTVGDSFVFGGTVTATYDNSETASIASGYTFSGYDMSDAGEQTVTVSYSEDGVNVTTTYTITVSEAAPSNFIQVNSFTNGKKYIIAANGSTNPNKKYYLPAATATVGSNPAASELTSLSDLGESDAWTVMVDGDSHIVFYNEYNGVTYYLVAKNESTGIKVVSEPDDGYWTLDSTGLTYSDDGTRYMATYQDGSFRYYTAPFNTNQSAANVFYEFNGPEKTLEDYLATASSFVKIDGEEADGSNTASLVFSSLGLANAADLSTYDIEPNSSSITFTKENASNGPKYYTSDSTARVYSGNKITFSSDVAITKIEFAGSTLSGLSSGSTGSYSDGVWSGEASEIVFSVSASVKLTSVKIYHGDDSITVNSISLRFGAKMSKMNWLAIKSEWGITDYGIMLVKAEAKNASDSDKFVQNLLTGSFEPAIYNKRRNDAPYADPYLDNGYYTFAVKINLPDDYDPTMVYYGAPFICVDGVYKFLTEKHGSVRDIASDNDGSNLTPAGLAYLSTH